LQLEEAERELRVIAADDDDVDIAPTGCVLQDVDSRHVIDDLQVRLVDHASQDDLPEKSRKIDEENSSALQRPSTLAALSGRRLPAEMNRRVQLRSGLEAWISDAARAVED
jgi:predicted RNase H-like nuclease